MINIYNFPNTKILEVKEKKEFHDLVYIYTGGSSILLNAKKEIDEYSKHCFHRESQDPVFRGTGEVFVLGGKVVQARKW